MPLQFQLKVTDHASPTLHALAGLKDDRTRLNRQVADHAAVLTRNHLAALNKHQTATRLGATPTGYYATKAESVEARATGDAAIVSIATGGGREAFARVFGEVTVRARSGKYLTIPATAAAYGRRAREFDGLRFIPFPNGTKALAKVTGTGKDRKTQVFYWLKESVLLPQDRSILPSDEQYLQAAERGANEYLDQVTRETTGQTLA
jgi:hypothetical protein